MLQSERATLIRGEMQARPRLTYLLPGMERFTVLAEKTPGSTRP